MCPGRVGEGLGSGGGEGDFSPAAAAFQRDWARPRGREAGRAAGVCVYGGEGASTGPTPGPSPGKQRVGECWKQLGPQLAPQDTPLSLRGGGPCWEPVEARCTGLGRRSGRPRSCQVNAARGNVREVSVFAEPKGLRNSCTSPPPPALPKAPGTRDPGWQPHPCCIKCF